MKIALIYPFFGSTNNQPNIKVVAENYGVFPPLSLSYVAAVLENEGHEVKLIDANALNLSKSETLKLIKSFSPNLLMLGVTTYFFHQGLEWIRFFKKNTELPIVVGGAHMSLYPAETLSYDEIDYGVIGEAEETLPEFVKAIASEKNLKEVRGVCYKNKGRIVITKPRGFFKNLDDSPFPARRLLPNEKYYSFISQRKNFTGLITTRGCPYKCVFCEQGSKPYRIRSAKNVVDEIEECYNEYGIREIDIFDSSFSINKKRVLEICKQLRSRRIDLDWSVRTRVDLVGREMLTVMSKAGCKRIYYGIESGDEQILRNIKKNSNLQLIRKTISLTKQIGIDTFGYFMIGNPGETEETIKKTITFAKSLDLDYAQFSKVSTLPGTELYELLKKDLRYDYWKEYVLDKSKEIVLPRHDCSFSEQEIQDFVKKAYKEFYFRPSYMIKALLRLKSWHEFKRSAKVAKSFVC